MKIKFIITLIITGIFLLSIVSLTSALTINSVSTDPDSIAPGESSKVSVSLKNNGNYDIEDVSISLDFTNVPLAPYNSGSDFSLSEILEGSSKNANFEMVALDNAKSGIYKIPVTITYTENSLPKTKQSLISIMVNSKPVIEVNSEDGLLLKGQNNQVSLKIINKGLADAKFLEIEVKSSTHYTILSQNKVYIGDVDSNDFQTADFKIFFKDENTNLASLPVTLRYKDIANNEYVEDSNINLKVYSKSQATQLGLISQSNVTIYVILVIILIVLFIVYRILRSRRKRNSEY